MASIDDLPLAVLLDILVRAGAWEEEQPTDSGDGSGRSGSSSSSSEGSFDTSTSSQLPTPAARTSPLSVCRYWRASLLDSPAHMARLLAEGHSCAGGPGGHREYPSGRKWEEALIGAATMGHVPAALYILSLPLSEGPAPRANCQRSEALVRAAGAGQDGIVRLLLEFPEDAPRANCHDGQALVVAAQAGHASVVATLLGWSVDAPRADCWGGGALVDASERGHVAVVRLLLECPKHPPRPDCQNRRAIERARQRRHVAVLRLLLDHLERTRDSERLMWSD
ncbi:hypothetical protein FOA52_006027 [Chlamydomonas sp. UWO 241]|nr:hypothetical protein FOA52_006027 [Chlamydomonas sp. UWO 241]